MPTMAITKDDLAKLLLVQAQDKETDGIRRRLAQIPEEVASLRAETLGGKTRLEAAKDKAQKLQLKRKERELEMGQKEAGIKKHQLDLNAVKTNDAFKALLKEIEEAKKSIGDLETEILTIMDEVDAAAKEEKAALADFKAFEARQNEAVKVLEARSAELEAALAASEDRRKALMESVPAELSAKYDKTRERRAGIGISRIEGNLCTECRMILPPQTIINVKKGHTIEFCDSCQRILHDVQTLTTPAA